MPLVEILLAHMNVFALTRTKATLTQDVNLKVSEFPNYPPNTPPGAGCAS